MLIKSLLFADSGEACGTLACLSCVRFYCSRVDAVEFTCTTLLTPTAGSQEVILNNCQFLWVSLLNFWLPLSGSYRLPSNFSIPVFAFFPTMPLGMEFYKFYSKLVTSRCVCMHVQSCLTLCDPVDCSPSGSSLYGIFQARILEHAAISFSRGSSQLRYWIPCLLASPALAARFFTCQVTRK